MDFCVFSAPIKVPLDAGVPAGAAGVQVYLLPPVRGSVGRSEAESDIPQQPRIRGSSSVLI